VIPAPSIAVTLSTPHAGARPVAVTLRLRYEMQCGWPGPGSLAIRLPAGMQLPARLPAGAVLVNDRGATAAGPTGASRTVTVGLPKRPQIMCDSIGPGTLTVAFTRAARLGNPHAAGSYALRATHGADRFSGRFAITR
jgi:hypothetical protein